jgi:hypothetical protein
MNPDFLRSTDSRESPAVYSDKVCDCFETALQAVGGGGPWPGIEDYRGDVLEGERTALLPELSALETYPIAPRFARGERMRSYCGHPPRVKG